MTSHNPLLDGLNAEQRAAVTAPAGPVLTVAGAGTGKTRVLTHRAAHLIQTGACRPDSLMAVTFTKKASNEMRERLTDMLGPAAANEIWIGSFHSLSGAMLRQHPTAAGLRNHMFTILDDDDQRSVLSSVASQTGYLPRVAGMRDGSESRQGRLLGLNQQIQYWKESGLTPTDVAQDARVAQHPEGRRILDVYGAYQETLAQRNTCDFPDLILHMSNLIQTNPEIQKYWRNKFQHVLVDEFQDTNPLQDKWLKGLSKGHGNIFAVGDPDQSIYRWRGARPEILYHFAQDWPGAQIYTLEENYRSTREILDISNQVVKDNPRVTPKQLRSDVGGNPVGLTQYANQQEEADGIATRIAGQIAQGHPPEEIAIIVRARNQIPEMERALAQQGIPFDVVSEQSFVQRDEIRDAHAYMTLAIEPSNELAFQRVFNKPDRNIDDALAWRVIEHHQAHPTQSFAASCRAVGDMPQHTAPIQKESLYQLAQTIDDIQEIGQGGARPGDMAQEVLQRVAYMSWRVRQGDPKAAEREASLQTLIEDANGRQDVGDYLQYAQLSKTYKSLHQNQAVRIMTVHASKGLEFDTVYAPAFEEGVLPNRKALQSPHGLVEESNIAHVLWTRARKDLQISYAAQRHYKESQPSRFLVDVRMIDPVELTKPLVPHKHTIQSDAPPRVRRAKSAWTSSPKLPSAEEERR